MGSHLSTCIRAVSMRIVIKDEHMIEAHSYRERGVRCELCICTIVS